MKFSSDLRLPCVHNQTHCYQVQHRDQCSTETTLIRRPGASVVLTSCVTASAMFTTASPRLPPLPLPAIVKNMGMKSVCCQHYDRYSLDVCRCYNRSPLDVYLPMSLSVSCGKNDFTHFIVSRLPSERYSMAILSCTAYSFYQLMLERRCQSLG
jgi:hypothetical protein